MWRVTGLVYTVGGAFNLSSEQIRDFQRSGMSKFESEGLYS